MDIVEQRPIRILAADDSVVMRGMIAKLFEAHARDSARDLPKMELCGVARDGEECLEAVKQVGPDVLILDLEMPRRNGLEVLDQLRVEQADLPVIMCSAYTERGARSTLEALSRGASDYVTKPSQQRDAAAALTSLARQLLPRIAALGRRSIKSWNAQTESSAEWEGRLKTAQPSALIEVVVIGSSTGGPAALERMLPSLPADFPVPVLIVQHMPKLFTSALAERLDRCSALRVEQAYENAVLGPGTIWLAPGDAHLEVAPRARMPNDRAQHRTPRGGRIRLHQQEPLNHCRPSVDYLFLSAARLYGAGALALVMTGMGSDGLDGARAVHRAGGVVLAQDESSSAVWGMPGRVSEAGIADATLPLSALGEALQQRVKADRDSACDQRTAAGVLPRREAHYGML